MDEQRARNVSYIWTHPGSGAGLFVGSSHFSPEEFHNAGVGAVLSLYPPPEWLGRERIGALEAYVDDADTLPGSSDEASAVAYAREALVGGVSLLVHCHGGMNRSPYIAARVMIAEGVPPELAVRHLLTRRSSQCLVNESFARALIGRGIPEEWRRL